MKKKFLLTLLTLCMIMTLVPASVSAAELPAETEYWHNLSFSEAENMVSLISNRSSNENIIFIYDKESKYASHLVSYANENKIKMYCYSDPGNAMLNSFFFAFFPTGLTYPAVVTYNGTTKQYIADSKVDINKFKEQFTETGLDKEPDGRLQPFYSDNAGKQDYTTYGKTIKSYLCENDNNGLTRVEYFGDKVILEDYDDSFTIRERKELTAELPIWGGFFAGEKYNFLIFGQENPNEDNDTEVIRVVKYSKNWERIGHASLNGANTTIPFKSGSLRCAEYGDMLYIRTCHQMYKSSDGLNHQANVMMAVKENDMTVSDSSYTVSNSGTGYVSHSFNQFIIVDNDANIVTADHGDAYPRSIVLMRYNAKAGGDKFSGRCSFEDIQTFPGNTGNNNTGASIGGLAELADSYVTVYNYDGTGTGNGTRDVYVARTSKNNLDTKTVKISSNTDSSTPILTSDGINGGYILWNEKNDSTLYYTAYSNEGTDTVHTVSAPLSDCQPICYNGKAVWYVTDNSAPTFYTLDISGVTAIPSVKEPCINHSYGDWRIITDATETTEGLRERICSVCGYKQTETIPLKLSDYTINNIIVENEKITIDITNNSKAAGTLIVAAYSEKDKLIDTVIKNVSETGSVDVTLNTVGAKYISSFVLDNITNLKPLSKKKTTDI